MGKKLEAICNRFETAWQGPNRPQIEKFLRDIPDGLPRTVLIRDLVLLDVYWRRNGRRWNL